jgi:hypothetical protein
VKLCANCQHFIITAHEHFCSRKAEVHMMDSWPTYIVDVPNAYCSHQRRRRWPLDILTRTCGRRARWFKQKENHT